MQLGERVVIFMQAGVPAEVKFVGMFCSSKGVHYVFETSYGGIVFKPAEEVGDGYSKDTLQHDQRPESQARGPRRDSG